MNDQSISDFHLKSQDETQAYMTDGGYLRIEQRDMNGEVSVGLIARENVKAFAAAILHIANGGE